MSLRGRRLGIENPIGGTLVGQKGDITIMIAEPPEPRSARQKSGNKKERKAIAGDGERFLFGRFAGNGVDCFAFTHRTTVPGPLEASRPQWGCATSAPVACNARKAKGLPED